MSDIGTPSSTIARKRPLAKRSCLKCREKKARCELPDVYVDSSKAPLPNEKRCHRCNVLDIDCIVWDGNRKRKPRLDPRNDSTPRTSAEREASSSSLAGVNNVSQDTHSFLEFNQGGRPCSQSHRRSDSNSSRGSSHNADAEQLAASDLSHAQHLLISRQKGWEAMSRTLHTLIERLQRERRYNTYLKLRIDAPPSTPEMAAFSSPERTVQLELRLQDYLVGHPYLPALSALQQQQTHSATRPRALLLATMTLLALKGLEDELASSEIRTLSSYIDRLGTQLLFSSPRDIHLVMAFEMLIAHEPGLVGTAASQFEPEGRGFGLASENLLTCAIKVAEELKLDDALSVDQPASTRLVHLSLWCCLKTWDSVYAFLGEKVTVLQDLHQDFAAGVSRAFLCVDDEGGSLPSPPRLQDASGSTAHSFHEMRTFCANAEKQLGRDGILRSAGRTVLCMRIQAACHLFDGLRKLQDAFSDASLSPERRQERISIITTQAYDEIMAVRHVSNKHLSFYAGQRLVRLWEQVLHLECAFFCAIYGSYATSAIFAGKFDAAVEPQELIRCVRFGLGPAKHIAEVGRFSLESSRTLLATVTQMDRQPALRKRNGSTSRITSSYLHRLPTLLVCAMAVHAARRCLESIAFVLVAWAHSSPDAIMAVTLMEAAAKHIRYLSPPSSNRSAHTIAQVSADYITEMIETARLWQIYYRVYRPVSSIKPNENSTRETRPDMPQTRGSDQTVKTGRTQASGSSPATGMDFLASAAEAAQAGASASSISSAVASEKHGTAPVREGGSSVVGAEATLPIAPLDVEVLASTWPAQHVGFAQLNPTMLAMSLSSNADLVDAGIFNASVPFDLEAFLKDVDQLF